MADPAKKGSGGTGNGVPVPAPTIDDIARLAYSYWEARGGDNGSPEDDWLRAERELTRSAR